MKPSQKTFTLWIVVILLFALISKVMMQDRGRERQISYSKFVEEVKQGNVGEVTLQGKSGIKGTFKQVDERGGPHPFYRYRQYRRDYI